MTPAERYLATSYRPDCEYVDGELLQRNVGDFDHSRMQALTGKCLYRLERSHGFRVLFAVRIQINPQRYRVPDSACCKMRLIDSSFASRSSR